MDVIVIIIHNFTPSKLCILTYNLLLTHLFIVSFIYICKF